MDEQIAWLTFAYALLISDVPLAGLAPGGVHTKYAPPGTPTPHVVLDVISAEDANGLGMTRFLTNVVGQANVYVTGNQIMALASVQRRVDQRLHGASGAAPNGGYVYGTERLRTFILTPPPDEQGRIPYLQGVGEYAAEARATA